MARPTRARWPKNAPALSRGTRSDIQTVKPAPPMFANTALRNAAKPTAPTTHSEPGSGWNSGAAAMASQASRAASR